MCNWDLCNFHIIIQSNTFLCLLYKVRIQNNIFHYSTEITFLIECNTFLVYWFGNEQPHLSVLVTRPFRQPILKKKMKYFKSVQRACHNLDMTLTLEKYDF